MAGLLSDGLERIVPWWLRNRPALDRGYKYLWASAVMCDALIDAIMQGVQSAWPGLGTSTALDEVGSTRGIVRGLSDTPDEYATRLQAWLGTYARMGSDEAIVRMLHEYLMSRPMVRLVDRHGQWTEINAAGVLRTFSAAWDWDSLCDPTAATARPTDVWVIVYGSAYAHQPSPWADLDLGHGLGHTVPLAEFDQAVAVLKQWKPAHNWIRCVIWVDDPATLDPEGAVGLPDGRWGMWGKDGGGGAWVPSRNMNFRYWEFEQ